MYICWLAYTTTTTVNTLPILLFIIIIGYQLINKCRSYLNWSLAEEDCCTSYESTSSDKPLGGFHDNKSLLALGPVDFTSTPSTLLGAVEQKNKQTLFWITEIVIQYGPFF